MVSKPPKTQYKYQKRQQFSRKWSTKACKQQIDDKVMEKEKI